MASITDAAALFSRALPEAVVWRQRPTDDDLRQLPGAAAVYLLLDEQNRPVLLATTQHLRRLSFSRLAEAEQRRGPRAELAAIVRSIRWRPTSCPFETRWWYWRLARELHPRDYRERIGFGPAWFLNLDIEHAAPEIRVSERIWKDSGAFLGPWPTRAGCQEALVGLWDLFDLCRYPDQVRKAPRGQRCAYAEMGRCDAPCDGSVSLAAYAERVRAAWRFAIGGCDEWVASAVVRMRDAASALQFERAAQIRQQIAFAEAWRRDRLGKIRLAEQLRFLLAIPATRRRAWKLFAFEDGEIDDGPVLPDRVFSDGAARWLASREHPAHSSAEVRMEQTWLLAHFVRHKESQAAIVISADRWADDLEANLKEQLSRRRVFTKPRAASEREQAGSSSAE